MYANDSFNNSICYWSVVCSPLGRRLLSRLRSAPCRLWLDLHLLQIFVGGVFVAVVLHLAEVAFLWCQHGVDLRDRHVMINLNKGPLCSARHNMLRVSYFKSPQGQ